MAEYSMNTTADEVLDGVDLSGKRALVTGVSTGIGREIARALVARGAQVVGTARDLAKATAATEGMNDAAPGRLDLAGLDLASFESIRATADRLAQRDMRFDIVVANAGIMAVPFGTTRDGIELQFGTNHLGHFLLINRLAPRIDDGGRVIVMAAAGHRFANVALDDPNFERTPYDPWDAYGRSKTANILFAVELDRRLRARGIRAAAMHPGAVGTELTRHLSEADMDALRARIRRFVPGTGGPPMTMKTAAQGAALPVWAATVADGDAIGGRYCVDFHPAAIAGPVGAHDTVEAYAVDPANAAALWARSEAMVGERF